MAVAYIALGSNLGDRAQTLSFAIDRLGRLGTVTARSSFYETEPVGFRDQPPFLNAVVAVETDLEPFDLLRGMLAIEREFGRDRNQQCLEWPANAGFGFAGDGGLRGRQRRADVASPGPGTAPVCAGSRWRRLLPCCAHPVLKQTMAELLELLPDKEENRVSAVRRIEGF